MSIFKAYDIRGVYPSQIHEEKAYTIGLACAYYFKEKKIIVGKDNRLSSPALAHALITGLRDGGKDVIDIGLCTTPMIYYAAQESNAIMVTASHNPKEYNGLKIVKEGSLFVGKKNGLQDIEKFSTKNLKKKPKGKLTTKNILADYIQHVLFFKETISRFNIVIDAGNGMAGLIIPPVFAHLSCVIDPVYFRLDGNYPHHMPNPLLPENVKDIQKRVVTFGAHLGITFDADVDRVVFIDENGSALEPDVIGAMIADTMEGTIICDVTCGKIIDELGKKVVRSKVGRTNISAAMRKKKAVFGYEKSGHYYFKDNFYTDNAIIAAIKVLNIFSKQQTTFSQLTKKYNTYSGKQHNISVQNQKQALNAIKKKYKKFTTKDGITVETTKGWFNIRPSNTEPLLRITVEATNKEERDTLLKDVINTAQKPL